MKMQKTCQYCLKKFYVKRDTSDVYDKRLCKSCQTVYDKQMTTLKPAVEKARQKNADDNKARTEAYNKAHAVQKACKTIFSLQEYLKRKKAKTAKKAAVKRKRTWTMMKGYSIPIVVTDKPLAPSGEWVADAFLGKSNAEVVMPIGMRVFGEMILRADGRVMFKVEDDQDNVSTVTLHWKQKV